MSTADEFPKHPPFPRTYKEYLARTGIGDAWDMLTEDQFNEQLEAHIWREEKALLNAAMAASGMAAIPSPHKSFDPVTGDCVDCGATREEIDDALAPTCYEHTGPHAEALRALARTMRREEILIKHTERILLRREDLIVEQSRHLRTAKAHLRELQASFEKLKEQS